MVYNIRVCLTQTIAVESELLFSYMYILHKSENTICLSTQRRKVHLEIAKNTVFLASIFILAPIFRAPCTRELLRQYTIQNGIKVPHRPVNACIRHFYRTDNIIHCHYYTPTAAIRRKCMLLYSSWATITYARLCNYIIRLCVTTLSMSKFKDE